MQPTREQIGVGVGTRQWPDGADALSLWLRLAAEPVYKIEVYAEAGGAWCPVDNFARLVAQIAWEVPGHPVQFVPGPGEPLLVAQALSAGHALVLEELFELAGLECPRSANWRKWPAVDNAVYSHREFGRLQPLATNGDVALVLWNFGRSAGLVRHENICVERDSAAPDRETVPATRRATKSAHELALEAML